MTFDPGVLRGDQRFLFLGKTRSGKSYLARYLLKIARRKGWRIVIVDPKKDWQGRGSDRKRPYAQGKSLGTVDSPRLVVEFDPDLAVQIFQPARWDESCARFFAAIMVVGYTIVYFDEIAQLVSASFIPIEFAVLWTQGAAISVGAWCGTQFPRRIPIIVKDQAEVWFIFRIINVNDRKVIGDYIPTEAEPRVVTMVLPYRWFWFWEDSMAAPVLVKPLKLERVTV